MEMMKGGIKLAEEDSEGKITVEKAAKLMRVSKEYVRMGLIQKKTTVWNSS